MDVGEARKAEKPRPRGSPMLLVLMAAVVVPSVVVADAFGAGAAGVVGGLVGMFSLVTFMGGPLRADLRLAVVLAPLLLFGAVVPRLLAEVSRPAAIALVVAIGFVAALLPLAGPRFVNAGLGLAMTTLFAYAYAINGRADHWQLVIAAVSGVAVGLLLRVAFGISDPSKPTREQAADVLVADDPAAATATAFGTWLDDGRPRWIATVLEQGSRYRLAVRAGELAGATGEDAGSTVAFLRGCAKSLAERVRAKNPPRRATDSTAAAYVAATAAGSVPLGQAAEALAAVERAARERDTTSVALDQDRRQQLRDAVLHPSARLRSVQVRHAFRTAFGLLAMLIITAGLEPGDPLVSTALLTTFGILQASWRDTLVKATNKIIGLVVGSVAVAVILLVVPGRFLTAIAAASLCLGLWYVVTRPALGGAFMVVVSVGFNSTSRDLDPVGLLTQYVALTACAVAVGVVLGFVVVPALRPAPLRRRVEAATQATAAVVQAASNGAGPQARQSLALHRDAAEKWDELVPDHDHLDDRQLAELDRLRASLRNLTTLVDAAPLDPAWGTRLLRALGHEEGAAGDRPAPDPVEVADARSWTLWDLAEQAGTSERYLLRTLPAG